MSFFTLSTGTEATGTAEASHTSSFKIIPDGTQAPAQIKEIVLREPTNTYSFNFYEVIFKIASGDYKSREVKMKIKCFDQKATVSDRSKNLLKRLFDLCNFVPPHENAPSTQDLYPLISKVLGIKISEFVSDKPREDGTYANSNYVSEIYRADKDFETISGVKRDVPTSAVETANSRNENIGLPEDSSDI